MSNIKHIRISGLHDRRSVELPFQSNHCVLIGPNGSGKSTALQIIAYTLGRQWHRLSSLPFCELEITFENGDVGKIVRDDCEIFASISERTSRVSSAYRLRNDMVLHEYLLANDLSDGKQLADLSKSLGIPTIELRQIQRYLVNEPTVKAVQKRMAELAFTLNSNYKLPVIYLPTYRRIELELRKIVEGLPEPYRKNIGQKNTSKPTDAFITEIVQFGMDDIEERISGFESKARDFARDSFNRMMASYLKEMANFNVISVSELRDIEIDQEQIDKTLSRIEEGLLSPTEKAQISEIIMELVSGKLGGHPPFYKKWLAHFYSRLYRVNQGLDEVEQPIKQFVETLNKYLFPKKADYDIEKYHFSIKDQFGRELPLASLSSGEKQIVSIMSELYFRTSEFAVFIDEPELSLSVPWQLEFLEDIAKSKFCTQVFAVTHSPFIYENAFSSSIVDFSLQ